MKIIVHTRKGGQGKSTTTMQLAAAFVERGLTGTVVDLNHSQLDSYKFKDAFPELSFEKKMPKDGDGAKRFVLVDTSADFEGPIVEAVNTADLVVIPVRPTMEGFEGLCRALENMKAASRTNPNLQWAVVAVGFSKSIHDQTILGCTRLVADRRMFSVEIPARSMDVEIAFTRRLPLLRLKPKNPVSKAYRELANEILDLFEIE